MNALTSPLTKKAIWTLSFKVYQSYFLKVYPAFFLLALINIAALFFHPSSSLNNQHISYPMLALSIITVVIYIILISFSLCQGEAVLQKSQERTKISLGFILKKLPILILACVIYLLSFVIGGVLLVLPAFFLSVALVCYFPLIILENKSPFTAWALSIKMVWGSWWRVFIILIVIGLIFDVIFFICFGTIGIIHLVLGAGHHLFFHLNAAMDIFNSFFLSYLPALYLVIWHDLKARYQKKILMSK